MQAIGPTAQRWRYPLVGLGICLATVPAVARAGRLIREQQAHRRDQAAARDELRAVAESKRRSVDTSLPTVEGDDLTMIEGIGPRVEESLRAAGVTSFAQLAALRPGRIKTILREAGGKMANPRSWPRQAALAAAGRWDELRSLQAEMHHGVLRT